MEGAFDTLEGSSAVQRDHDKLEATRSLLKLADASAKSCTRGKKNPIHWGKIGTDWEAASWKWVIVNNKLNLSLLCGVAEMKINHGAALALVPPRI